MSGSGSGSGLTILQVLPWLNYGGVESYCVRLARGLTERGHRVLVASRGGELVSELTASGIEHLRLDFTGVRMPVGVMALRRLLEREHVDIVNAHNWRAGMVSYLACGKAGVPYVLTIHGTRRPLNRFGVFYWSNRMVVVSEASRRNLVEGFGLPAERVTRSMIGVDCRRFHPDGADPLLADEIGLDAAAPHIVHVSRFSHSKAPVALALVEAMEQLEHEAPGTELVLVGEGPEERAVHRAADRMNERLGRRGVFSLGGRGDIDRILGLADVVVGTASVALEAMACGKPVVAAGKGGYFGIVRPEHLAEAEQSCFADHETVEQVTPDRLAADVAGLLRDPGNARQLGEFGRATAEARYDAPRLAEHVESIYREELCARERIKRIVVFHLNQIGDLTFTLPALKTFREQCPQAHITSVLRPHLAGLVEHSGLVDEIMLRPAGRLHAAIGMGLRLARDRPDMAVAFSQSATMVLCARLSGARHRVGYADSDLARLLNHRIQVRGIPCPEKVLRLVRGLGLAPSETDYVGLVTLSEHDERFGEQVVGECASGLGGPLIALAPGESAARPYKSWSTEGFRRVAAALVAEEGARVVVVGGPADRSLGEEIVADLEGRGWNLAGRTTPSQLAGVLKRCDLLIGIDSGPMHVAAAMGRPVVGLFGPTDPWRTGPLGDAHEVIFHRQPCWGPCVHPVAPTCSKRLCMDSIGVEEVLAAARRLLARRAEPAARDQG